MDVYGKHTAYTSPEQLYATAAGDQGTKLGSIVCGTDTELTISGDYEFIGMRSNNGAMYLNSIQITWETGAAPTESIIYPLTQEVPFGQVDTAITCKNDYSAATTFNIVSLEPMQNANGDVLPWTVTGGGEIAAGQSFDLSVHIETDAWAAAKPGPCS